MRCISATSIGLLMLVAGALPAGAAPLQWPAPPAMVDQTADLLRYMVAINGAKRAGDTPLAMPEQVSRLYWQRDFKPVWLASAGVRLEAAELLQALRRAEDEGLPAQEYPVAYLEQRLFAPLTDPVQLAQLDMVLTDAYLHYSWDVHSGRFDPRATGSDWFIPRQPFDAAALLPQALAQNSLLDLLAALPPSHTGYRRLRAALQQYRAVAAQGGWPQLEFGSILRLGDSDPRVVPLRRRLVLSGDLPPGKAVNSEVYDAALRAAVQHFQRRHGLQADGSVGDLTVTALNVPVEERIRQIEANMERWRWLPHTLESRYIVVNMAGYELRVVESERTVLKMRVIVGRDYRQTPVFASTMTSLVLNPYWYVPRTIFRDDILPRLRQDAGLLDRLNIRLFTSLQGNGNEVDATSVDWQAVDGDSSAYLLRQDPGAHNALGRIKFMLPNSYGIYLHDTPDRSLFNQPTRAFSSGCVRVELPVTLAQYVLADEAQWNRATLEAAIQRGKPATLALPEPIPVYLLYWTAWVDEDGNLQFRDDIYGRDQRLLDLWHGNRTGVVAATPNN